MAPQPEDSGMLRMSGVIVNRRDGVHSGQAFLVVNMYDHGRPYNSSLSLTDNNTVTVNTVYEIESSPLSTLPTCDLISV